MHRTARVEELKKIALQTVYIVLLTLLKDLYGSKRGCRKINASKCSISRRHVCENVQKVVVDHKEADVHAILVMFPSLGLLSAFPIVISLLPMNHF